MKKLTLILMVLLLALSGCTTPEKSPGETLNDAIASFASVDTITLDDQEAIATLRVTLEALSVAEKAHVTEANIQKLEVLEEQINILLQQASNQAVANAVAQLMTELPSLATLSIDDLDAIALIRFQYDTLTLDQQNLFNQDAYDLFLDYESKMQNDLIPPYQLLEEAVLPNLKTMLRDAIPEEITDPMQLPTTYTEGEYDFTITWTANHLIVTPDGVLSITPLNATVTLTAHIEGKVASDTQDIILFMYGYRVIDMPDIDPDRVLTFAYLRNNGYGTNLVNRDYAKLDVINYSFSKIINGEVSVLGLYYLNSIINLRKTGTRIVMVIDGVETTTRAAFVEAASSDANRKLLASSIVSVIEEYQLDGVDLDWEYPQGTIQINNFSLLCEEIRTQLDNTGRKLILSAAVRAGGYSTHYNLPVIDQYIDYLHIMTYGMGSRSVSLHQSALYRNSYAPYSISSAVDMYINGGMSREKIVFGIPFYVIMGDFVTPNPTNPLGQSITNYRSVGYGTFNNLYYNKNGFVEHYDAIAQVYYSVSSTTFATYDNPASIILKAQWAIDNHIAGVMFWEYSHDMTNGVLLDAIYQTFNQVNQ